MTEKPNKQKDSIAAMKDASKHLQDIFKQMEKMDNVLYRVSTDLSTVISKIGDIQIEVYHDGGYKPKKLRIYLEELKKLLDEVRI